MKKDERVDAYIKNAPLFAQPILHHLRVLIHKVSPNINETIKWGFPNFEYKEKILCSFAAFKGHCAFNLWLHSLVIPSVETKTGMGSLGKILSLRDLPTDGALTKILREAIQYTEEGRTISRRSRLKNEKIITPEYLQTALEKNKIASENYEAFSSSKKKEYIEWITEAKTGTTRDKRLSIAVEWIAEGKTRHWKYK
ncbi:YdeI/OmpD-associated family protein [Arachidicoccus sp.]|uniref:YdeI/OmpD-associated family protein n=1 Tax=Arachidicoccus sp. TaxID=1872624 RepID=UPI003D1DD21E